MTRILLHATTQRASQLKLMVRSISHIHRIARMTMDGNGLLMRTRNLNHGTAFASIVFPHSWFRYYRVYPTIPASICVEFDLSEFSVILDLARDEDEVVIFAHYYPNGGDHYFLVFFKSPDGTITSHRMSFYFAGDEISTLLLGIRQRYVDGFNVSIGASFLPFILNHSRITHKNFHLSVSSSKVEIGCGVWNVELLGGITCHIGNFREAQHGRGIRMELSHLVANDFLPAVWISDFIEISYIDHQAYFCFYPPSGQPSDPPVVDPDQNALA